MAKNINLKIELQNAQQAREELIRLQDSTIEGSKQFKKLEEQIKKLDEVTQDYSDAVTELEIAQNNGAKNTKFFSDNLKKAEKSLEQATKKSNSLSTSVSKLNEATEKASQGWSSLTDGFSQLKSGDLVGGLSSIRDGVSGLTKASLAFIATPIGATIAALSGIAIGAKALWDYNDALAQSNKITEQFTGLTGDSLDVVDAKTKALMSQTGGSQEEILRSAQALVTQFGISYEEAFDQISVGYLRSGKSAEDFFDNIAEYSTFFEKAGFTAEEMFGIIEAGAENGIYKDKILDTVKEMDIALKEMPKASADALRSAFGTDFTNSLAQGINNGTIKTKEALALIGEEAKKAGISIQDQSTLTADLFRSAGEDAGGFADVIDTINLGLEKSTAELKAVEQAQLDSNNAQAEMNVAFRDLFGMSEGGFAKMKSDLMTGVYQGITMVINGVIDCYNWFAELYNKSYAFRGVVGSIGAVAQTLFNIISANIKNVVNGFKSLGDLIEAVFTGNFSSIPSIISKAFNNSVDTFKKAANDSADAFVEAWDEKGGKLKTIEKKNTDMVIGESNKATKELIKNNNKLVDTHEKNEEKKRKSTKKTSDEAKKALDAYNKGLLELNKTYEVLNSKSGVGGLSKNITNSVSDFKNFSKTIETFIKLINKSNRTDTEKAFIEKFLDGSVTKSATAGFDTLAQVREAIETINNSYQEAAFNYRNYIKTQQDGSEEAKKQLKVLSQYESQLQALVPIEQQVIKSLMAFKDFQKLQSSAINLNTNSLSGKHLNKTLRREMSDYMNGLFKEIPTNLTEFNGWKQFVESVKDISEESWKIFVESQPDGMGEGLKMIYDKWKKDQEELNKLVENYDNKLNEISNKQKDFTITDFQKSNSGVNGFMESLGGGDIFGAKSSEDMKAEIESISRHNQDIITAQKSAEIKKLKDLNASEEEIQKVKDFYRQQEIDAEKDKADAILQIDQLTAQRREQALSQTADTLSQASGLFAEHTTAYKVFAIAAATIDTYQSAMAAYKGMVATIPGAWGIAAGIAAAASSVAFGIKQIKEIQKVDTGGSAGGGTAIANVSQSPNVQFVSSGDNQIAQTIASSQASSEELRVVVTANDIQNGLNTQARVRKNSSL